MQNPVRIVCPTFHSSSDPRASCNWVTVGEAAFNRLPLGPHCVGCQETAERSLGNELSWSQVPSPVLIVSFAVLILVKHACGRDWIVSKAKM